MASDTLVPDRLKTLLAKLRSTTIVVVGDTMIDEYFWGDVQRISPEAPVPVVEVESVSRRLGGAANVVQNLTRLGVQTELLSLCGSDENGNQLLRMLQEIGCGTEGLHFSQTRPTTIKTRIVARHQQVVRADREKTDDCTAEESDALLTCFNRIAESAAGVIISDYGKGVISPAVISSILKICHSKKVYIAIDPKDRHIHLYKKASVITPNLREAHMLAGEPYRHCSDDAVIALGWKLIAMYHLQHLLITLSERGMALFTAENHQFRHLPTVAQNVFDVTGAGDTVISVFTAAIAVGASPFDAAIMANHAAGLTCAQLGTASVTPDEIIAACASV